MQFQKFSRTGLMVSRLCLGTGTFGKQTDEAESVRLRYYDPEANRRTLFGALDGLVGAPGG